MKVLQRGDSLNLRVSGVEIEVLKRGHSFNLEHSFMDILNTDTHTQIAKFVCGSKR